MLRLRSIQCGRRTHSCNSCRRILPVGDPKWERSQLEQAVRHTYVRSLYFCRTCNPRR